MVISAIPFAFSYRMSANSAAVFHAILPEASVVPSPFGVVETLLEFLA